jgi:hypothetical protein
MYHSSDACCSPASYSLSPSCQHTSIVIDRQAAEHECMSCISSRAPRAAQGAFHLLGHEPVSKGPNWGRVRGRHLILGDRVALAGLVLQCNQTLVLLHPADGRMHHRQRSRGPARPHAQSTRRYRMLTRHSPARHAHLGLGGLPRHCGHCSSGRSWQTAGGPLLTPSLLTSPFLETRACLGLLLSLVCRSTWV